MMMLHAVLASCPCYGGEQGLEVVMDVELGIFVYDEHDAGRRLLTPPLGELDDTFF